MALVTLNLSSREDSLKNLDKLPRLSPLLVQFLGLVSRPNCEVSELAAVVGKDALLSAQILQKANSAVFGRVQPINTVHHAIAMLGVGIMRRFALGSSISNLFSRQRTAPSFSMTRFNLHSVATGTLVELLADELPVASRESALVAGLLHDLGKLLIAVHMPRQFEDTLGVSRISGVSALESERQLMGTDHAELSALATERWDLDAAITIAARHHHEPANAKESENVPEGTISLTLVVHKADAFVNYLGMSVLPPVAAPSEPPDLDFGIPYSEERVRERFQAEWKNLLNLFR
jgi:putative nucleotidyltransferase with HDIG domain